MENKPNCWDFMNCSDRDNHHSVGEGPTCPAHDTPRFNGVNGGKNGGRFCWAIPGTQCRATQEQKVRNCMTCAFYRLVKQQEGDAFVLTPSGLIRAHAIK